MSHELLSIQIFGASQALFSPKTDNKVLTAIDKNKNFNPAKAVDAFAL